MGYLTSAPKNRPGISHCYIVSSTKTRLQIWEDVAEKCEALGKTDPFTYKWYREFWCEKEGEDWWIAVSSRLNIGDSIHKIWVELRNILGADHRWTQFWAAKARDLGIVLVSVKIRRAH